MKAYEIFNDIVLVANSTTCTAEAKTRIIVTLLIELRMAINDILAKNPPIEKIEGA